MGKLDTTPYRIEMTIAKAINEVLAEFYFEKKYSGFVDLWPEVNRTDSSLALGVNYKTIKSSKEKLTKSNASRFEIIPNQGVRKVC